jgi:hypothetical protein
MPRRPVDFFSHVSHHRYPGVDLTISTTVAWPNDAAFVCAAHKHKVKVVINPPSINLTAMHEPAAR